MVRKRLIRPRMWAASRSEFVMVALGVSRVAQLAPYGVAALFLIAGSTRIGYQDIAALMAQQPAVSDRWREHVIASPFGTIHAAILSLPQPLGTLVPAPQPVRFARANADPEATQISRARKGDLLVPRLQVQILAELLREDALAAQPETTGEIESALRFEPFPEYDLALSLELHPQAPAATNAGASAQAVAEEGEAQEGETPFGAARLYFEAAPMNAALAGIEPWAPGEAPILVLPAVREAAVAAAAVGSPAHSTDDDVPSPSQRKMAPEDVPPRPPTRPRSPADLLQLTGKARVKAEKCLANAVYFEARSEPVRGQVAVAQVVLNRVFSEYYPDDVCGVVYQNANRHLSCQFTFACDGIPDVVTEPEHWQRAMRIAKTTLDGKVWLADVGKATHYHASYVYPYWVRSMRKLKKIGLHTFYRPRRWGDGSDEPAWGGSATPELVAKL